MPELKDAQKNWKDLQPNSFETDCNWMAIVGKNSASKWNDTSFEKIAKIIWIAYARDQISLIEKCHSIDFENFLTQNISEFCIEMDWYVQIVWWTNCLSLEYLDAISWTLSKRQWTFTKKAKE